MAEITDPQLKFLNVKSDKANRREHNTAILFIAHALSKSGIEINYDHVNSTVRKNQSIPLLAYSKKKKQKADLAFMLHNDTLVHVHVDVFQRELPPINMNITNTKQAKRT